MNLLSIHEADKEIADKLLYEKISFGINESDKIALIGVNGSGKSTLMKILANYDSFDNNTSEKVFAKNKILKIGYLEQNTQFNKSHSIQDFIFSSDNKRMKVLRDYLYYHSNDFDSTSINPQKIEEIEIQMETLDVWKLQSEAKEILYHLNIHDLNLQMNELSGGMVKKVALARLLIEDNNLLLLDEPTNHLDITSIVWLEEYLIKIKKAILLVTHDRYFLDNVVDYILEIDNFKVNKYVGNYSTFLEKKAEIAIVEQRTLSRHQNILRTELEWLKRMPKARGTKQKARIQNIEQRQSIVENTVQIQKMDKLFSQDIRLGKTILKATNISKKYSDEIIFSSFTYEFSKNDRIAIIGSNGAGKTTFFKILMSAIENENKEKLMVDVQTDTGKVTVGVNTRIGYLSQYSQKVDDNLSLIQAVKEIANYIELDDKRKITAGQLLEKFLFSSKMHYQKIQKLSGGERRRLDIILILMQNPNFLILDEPTNDLDLQTLSILEDYLLQFPGCILIASHDRYFLDKLTTMNFIFEKGREIEQFPGMCSDYLYAKKQLDRENNKSAKNSATNSQEKSHKKNKIKTKLSYKDKRRKEEIEKEMPILEADVQKLEKQLSSGETDHTLLEKWSLTHSEKENLLFDLLSELESIEDTVGKR